MHKNPIQFLISNSVTQFTKQGIGFPLYVLTDPIQLRSTYFKSAPQKRMEIVFACYLNVQHKAVRRAQCRGRKSDAPLSFAQMLTLSLHAFEKPPMHYVAFSFLWTRFSFAHLCSWVSSGNMHFYALTYRGPSHC